MSAATPRFALGLAAVYLLVAGLGAWHHEPWLDEAQSWLLATRAGSIADVFKNLAYEGHPPLWHLLLHALGLVVPRIEAMQGLAVALGAATVFLVGWRSPLDRLQKALFAFGYFPLFEYGVVARSYAVGLALLAAYIALRHAGSRRGWLLALPLALLAQTSLFGIVLAWALLVGLAVEAADPDAEAPLAPGAALVAGGMLAASTGLAARIMQVPPDASFMPAWHLDLVAPHVADTLSAVIGAWLPIPDLATARPWNSRGLVAGFGYNRPDFLLGAGILGLAAAALAGRPAALAAFGAGTVVLLAFFHVKLPGDLRHHGHLFLLWLACLAVARPAGTRVAPWLARVGPAAAAWARRNQLPAAAAVLVGAALFIGPGAGALGLLALAGVALGAIAAAPGTPAADRLRALAAAFRPGGAGLTALLAIHVGAAAWLFLADWGRPFGAGTGFAAAIRSHPAAAAPILVLDDRYFAHAAPPVAAALGRELTFVTMRETYPGSFLVWDQRRMFELGVFEQALARVPAALPATGPAWLLTNEPITRVPPGMRITPVVAAGPGVCRDEPPAQRLYLAERSVAHPPPP